ncbi:hypothetical protein [Rhizobium laguerreae]|uniref:hypothetical protein n=1 Tax=Rhizobium laguerreae TaxID=1076926 RepID=UPI001C9075DC|nr:hypothetical protein [Rhizobium laguerreae]MBY3382184.1 hypothetical protein [Rhizobium laguerreae]
MENELRFTLLETASTFAKACGCALSTVSRRVKNDAAFFSRIKDTSKTFTARTFDEVMLWFAENWPAGKQMPLGLMKWMAETGYQRAEIA